MISTRALSLFIALLIFNSPLAAQDAADEWPAGTLPVGADGKPLNLDFETGDLSDWSVSGGKAFKGQPVKGDTVAQRRPDMTSGHRGDYWIGTFERGGDPVRGELKSETFKITHPFASFLVGGGSGIENRVELIDAASGEVLFRAGGQNDEHMRPVVIDLSKHEGKTVFLRVVDVHRGAWGHINFDDFQFHEKKPVYPVDVQPVMAHGLPADEAAEAMDLPAGFEATLFAAEPDVVQPIAMTIDDRGRLWVAEGLSYPVKRPADEAKDRILIFEDTNRDGEFDKRKVFIDGLNLVSGLEVGHGGVWIGQAPELLFVPDKNGDDVPDAEPKVLLDGWHYEDTHETLNSFIWGPDGWLYGCHGVFTHSLVGKPGTPKDERTQLNAGIWRYHPTRHEFEVFAHGTSNPWGVDFNDQGQCFLTCCVIPHLFHVIEGARYRRQAGRHFSPYTYNDIKTIAKHRHWAGNQWNQADREKSATLGGGHAHSGAMIYLGGRWPEKYRNQIFMNNIHGDRLNQDRLTARESGYVGNRAPDFCMANDAASQMIYLRYGPDGNAYVIDWYDTNECHRRDIEIHDRSNGRIFKIDYTSNENVDQDAYRLPASKSLKDLESEKLAELMLHGNDWYVRHARRILAERGGNEATVKTLEKIAFEHEDSTRRLRGLWGLRAVEALTPERIERALDDKSPYMRGWAIQLSLDGREPTSELLKRFEQMAREDASPVVRLYLASACQNLSHEQRRPILSGLLTHEEDANDHNLPLMSWYATEPLAAEDMAGTLELVRDSKIPVVREYTLRRIAEIGSEEAIAFLIEALGETQMADRRQEFLDAINTALKGRRHVAMPAPWKGVYEKLVTSDREAIVREARALAATFGDPRALTTMREILRDNQASTKARQSALAALLKVRDEKLPAILQDLVGDSAMGREAIRGLAAFESEKTPKTLIAAYPKLDPAARRDALATLAARPGYASKLLDAVADETIPRTDLSAGLIRQLRNLDNEKLTTRLNEVWGLVRDSPEEKKKLIALYRLMLAQAGSGSDVHLGRAVYDETCAQCHKLFGTGGEVGPELTGSNRSDLDYLLTNVLDPSAVMAKDYRPDVVVNEDGRVITGIVTKENDDAVTLVTENETVIVPKDEIIERVQSDTSMMPDNLWKTLSDNEVRSLVAYLASPRQVAPKARPENAKSLFNGRDLTGWSGDKELWKVEDGEIVGTSPGIDHNSFLVSELLVGDFDLTVEVKLTPNTGNSGIQFRSEPLESGEMKGYQADMGAGWWGKLYEERGRGLLWKKSAQSHVKPGEWNSYRIRAVGNHIQTWLNGEPCVDFRDETGAEEGRIGLQIHSGGPLEVRFRKFALTVDPGVSAEAVAKE